MRSLPHPGVRAPAAIVVALAALVVSGCTASTPPLVATTLVLSALNISLDAIGATQTLNVTVNDQHGAPMSGQTVTWTSTSPAIAMVSGSTSATVTAVANGTTALTAKVGNATATAAVTVAQTPVEPAKVSGDAQTGTVGTSLATPVRVKVQDRLNNAMVGVVVTFTPGAGSGSVSPATASSGADGNAVTTWTLGTQPGPQTLTVSATGATAATNFTATANVGPPAQIAVNAGNNQSATVGTAVATAPAVRVADQFGNPVPGATVTFSANNGGTLTGASATTNATGIATVGSWTLGTTSGTQTLTATVSGVTPLNISATARAGPATAIVATAGDAQTVNISTATPIAPAVRVNDAFGNGVSGVGITFAVTGGGGSLTGATATTSGNGAAAVGSWTMGPAAGPNTLTATGAGTLTGNPVTFTATAVTSGGSTPPPVEPFNIDVRFLTSASAAQTAAFASAAARWQSIITAGLVEVPVNFGPGSCGSNSPAISETIDDVVIFVTLEPIDGPGNVLGSAGPCAIRTSNSLTVFGRMRFDTADLATLETNGLLNGVILHEMGHVLGIGSLWTTLGLLANPSLPSSPGADTRFTGVNAIDGFDAIGGTTYTGGGKVPVENTQGGSGTRDSHWRESVLANELMTGFINNGSNPLSVLTIRSVQDLGYSVSITPADPFFLTLTAAAVRTQPEMSVELKNDVNKDPILVIDERGRVLRVLRPPPE